MIANCKYLNQDILRNCLIIIELLLIIILKPVFKLAIFPNTDSWRLGCKLINSVAMHFVILPLATVSGSVTPSHSTKDNFTRKFIII